MKSRQKLNQAKTSRLHPALVTTALLASGFFQFVSPALAQTTSAGTVINNQATATYEDPNNPPDPNNPNDPRRLNTTSNTVTVTVAEVAGISVVAGTPVDNNAGTIQTGDLIYYPFTITNVGNDPTRFQIPTQAGITGPGTVGTLQYSTNGTSWTDVPNGGFTTASIPVNGTIQVRVPVTVNSGVTPGQTIKVTLGETTPAETATNSPRAGSVNDNRDVYTVDNLNGTPEEVTGLPANGVVEGSAAASITVSPKYYSLATILKTRGNYSNNGTPGDITDDTIDYNLSLRVESSDVTGQSITPSPLAGSTVPGLPGSNILVADAIPFGTQLAVAPTVPTGWQVVYSTTPVTTSANVATWTTVQPGDLGTVTRIGFIKPTTDGDTNTYLAANGQSTSFSMQLRVRTGQTAPLTIANIAQVFGKTPETNAPVLDESGDQNPSNFDGTSGNMTPPSNTDTNGDNVPDQLPPTVPDGYITDPKTDPSDLNTTGTDTAGDNTGDTNNPGANAGGEANVFSVNVSSVVNGPNGSPDAVGPTDNNDDFTNRSSNVPANTAPGSTFDPNVINFTNTVRNSGTQADNISLLPTPPANTGDLQVNTVVTISANNGATIATYTYNGTQFNFTSGTGLVGGNPVSATNPVRIDNVAANGTANYTVTVDLPPTTPLSTDPGFESGFPVPITAFIDSNSNGLADDAAFNITIDRVYTGFLQLIKQSRILQGTGPAVQGTDGTLSTTPKTPAPGNIIEYVIQYKNISEPAVGTGNVILNAGNVVITEDGTASPNNWAIDNAPSNGIIDTSHVLGSAQGAGTIQYFSGTSANNLLAGEQSGSSANSDITKYINTLTNPVAPGQTGTFTFQRKVN
ncbi:MULTISPECIES: hypothetical protein [unclassified Anabaena]|uniref:beta strand repeat-containing protein n=1 Tax=unclassified Anabaena TaxID=2619674 RepID=UPI000834A92E|nr:MULTISPECIES: hypothetical protein [unclassified Anabaena]